MEGGKRDEVGFVERGEFEKSMADLLDLNCARERGFLSVITLKLERLSSVFFSTPSIPTNLDAMFLIPYAIRCHRRVMAVSC